MAVMFGEDEASGLALVSEVEDADFLHEGPRRRPRHRKRGNLSCGPLGKRGEEVVNLASFVVLHPLEQHLVDGRRVVRLVGWMETSGDLVERLPDGRVFLQEGTFLRVIRLRRVPKQPDLAHGLSYTVRDSPGRVLDAFSR